MTFSTEKYSATFFPPSLFCCSCWHHCLPTENTTLYVHWCFLFTARVENPFLYSVFDKHHLDIGTSCSKQTQCYCKHSTHFFTQCSISSVKTHEFLPVTLVKQRRGARNKHRCCFFKGTLMDRFCLVCTDFCYILFSICGSDPPEQPKPKWTCQATAWRSSWPDSPSPLKWQPHHCFLSPSVLC